jgi:hypothetical protein
VVAVQVAFSEALRDAVECLELLDDDESDARLVITIASSSTGPIVIQGSTSETIARTVRMISSSRR